MVPLRQIMVRLPFTLAMLMALAVGAWCSNTFTAGISEEWCQSVGCSPTILLDGKLHRLFTSLFFTAGGIRFLLSWVMLATAVGITEWKFGSLRALATFFSIHVITLIVLLGAIQLARQAGVTEADYLHSVCDVGPSAGYYGCLGLVTVTWPASRIRRRFLTIVMTLLFMRVAWSAALLPQAAQDLSADLAHALAFLLGCWSAAQFPVAPTADESEDRSSEP